MKIYFKGTRDILGINLRDSEISLLLNRTLAKNIREQWNLEQRKLLIKGSMEHAPPFPSSPLGDPH